MNDERALLRATKPELVVLNNPDLNAETPAHLLDDDITPLDRLFVRNTGRMPDITEADVAAWTLTIDGFVEAPHVYSVPDLKQKFETVTQVAVLECAGNGRAFFPEPAGEVLWRHGAVFCVAWTGVRLGDILRQCRLGAQAFYTAHRSPDLAIDGQGPAISRGLPIAKALAPETLIAFAINGEPMPLLNGGPLRIVAPGYPGSASQKWLNRITVRDREHDGARMTGIHYRLPRRPLRRGEPIDPSEFEVITDMPVRSVITSPREAFSAPAERPLTVRGHAWSGHIPVARVEMSADGGRSWQTATLGAAPDAFAWRRFKCTLANLPRGAVEIIARATDTQGHTQPLASAPWNPRGYCNNTVHRLRGELR